MKFGHIVCLVQLSFLTLQIDSNSAAGCSKNDAPCIYVSRDTWVDYEEPKYDIPPPSVRTDSWNRSETTLFLTIASYRDKLCPVTLFNLFTKARYQERIFVGVVQQNVASVDVDCLMEYCRLIKQKGAVTCLYEDNIRMDRVDADKAKGPVWARARGSKLLRDEEFCMQTDAHMDFVPDWDIKMMRMWAQTNNEYGMCVFNTDFD